MDMAVAILFKHKIRFELSGEGTDRESPRHFKRTLYYRSRPVENENVESIGLNNINDLCTICCKPFVLYALSKVIHEERVIPIDEVKITVGVVDLDLLTDDEYTLTTYRYDCLWGYPEFFFTYSDVDFKSFPKYLLHKRFYVLVKVKLYYICNTLREEARFRTEFNYDRYWHHPLSIEEYLNSSGDEVPAEEVYDSESTDEEEEYTPTTETYRQSHCVICLEAKPNILYLDCKHIAVCDSCDCLKEAMRYKCDMCRRRVFERVKI